MSARSFFSKEDQEDITLAIQNAELDTSGEIRVHVEETCKGDARDRAAFVFEKLKMHETEQRNGVLFYIAVKNRKFAILGDAGINSRVGDGFWDEVRDILLDNFRDNKFAEGLVGGINLAGKQLKRYFPYQKDDVNELPDEISFDDAIQNN